MSSLVNVSDAVALGIHAATLLAANPDRSCTSREMAELLEVSEAHLAKVMQRLSRAGIVRSTRGPRGGFILAGSAAEITFLQVYEAIDGPLTRPGCLIGQPKCKGDECVMGGLLHDLYEQTLQYFSRTTLAELADRIMVQPSGPESLVSLNPEPLTQGKIVKIIE